MAKSPISDDPDFIKQYGNGVHQYGTVGASDMNNQMAEEFQSHMDAKQAQVDSLSKVTPQNMLNVKNTVQLGPPDVQKMQGPAPENFGPPKITQISTDNKIDFGPPGSKNVGGLPKNFGPPKPGGSAQTEKQMQSQLNQQAQKTTEVANNTTKPPSLGAHPPGGGGKGKKDSPTYKEVETTEVNNMLENAMAHMKFKDPDPSAWS